MKIRREELGRYGLSIDDVNMFIETALGGAGIVQTVEGRRRFSIAVRMGQEFRNTVDKLKQLPIITMNSGPIPLGALADVVVAEGPPMITSENAMLRGTLLFNVRDRDLGSTVDEARRKLQAAVQTLPKGYFLDWSGQYENQIRAEKRLMIIMPIVLLIIIVILYFTFRNLREVAIVLSAIPVALVGGAYSLYFFDVNFSVAVAVGFIALFGIAVETGVLMLVYLNNSLFNKVQRAKAEGVPINDKVVEDAVYDGAVLRLRPKLMTVIVDILGLMPVLLATGPGSDVMKPITIPFVFGLITSTLFVLIVLPVMYSMVRENELKNRGQLRIKEMAND